MQAFTADSATVTAHRASLSMAAEAGAEHAIGRGRGGPTTKMHTLLDSKGRLFFIHRTCGNASDCEGFKELLMSMPLVEFPDADCGHDADRVRNNLDAPGIQPCIPGHAIEKRRSTSTRTSARRSTGSKTLRHHLGLETRRAARPRTPKKLSRSGHPCGHLRLLAKGTQ